MIHRQQGQHEISLPESRPLIVNADEDLGDVFFCRLLSLGSRRLSNVDRWEAVVSDGMGAIEIALDSIFVLLVDSPSLVSEGIDNVTS